MFGTTLGPLLMRDAERSARLLTSRTASNGYKPAAASGNALPHFCGGQVVSGSNPVSPAHVIPTQHYCGSFLKEWAGQDPRLCCFVRSASFLVLAERVEVGVGVKARAQPDRVAAVGP